MFLLPLHAKSETSMAFTPNKPKIRQHPFAIPIDPAVKAGLTVCPPPFVTEVAKVSAKEVAGVTSDILLSPYTESPALLRRYADMAEQKKMITVRIDEELDSFRYPNSNDHYRMMIRDISSRADLTLIMEAALHLGLISTYSIRYDVREGLKEDYERAYIDVEYTIGYKTLEVDGVLTRHVPIIIPYAQRRSCWRGLFEALGYVTRWGDCVLNVKRK